MKIHSQLLSMGVFFGTVFPSSQALSLIGPEANFSVLPNAVAAEPDFSGDGRSGNRIGGGSRSDCPTKEVPLTALMPISNSGQTTAAHPSFWVYVPYTPEEAPVGEFVLQDQDRNDVYREEFTLPNTPGVTSVSLPETETPLSLRQPYRWYFHLYCDRGKASSPVFVQGWVERVELTANLELSPTQAPEQYPDYIAQEIWWDAIAALAILRSANSADPILISEWNALLTAEGVDLKLPDNMNFMDAVTFQ